MAAGALSYCAACLVHVSGLGLRASLASMVRSQAPHLLLQPPCLVHNNECICQAAYLMGKGFASTTGLCAPLVRGIQLHSHGGPAGHSLWRCDVGTSQHSHANKTQRLLAKLWASSFPAAFP